VTDETTPQQPVTVETPSPGDTVSPWTPDPSSTPPPPAARRLRTALGGAAIGGLVGALAAGGLFVATDDNGSSTTVVERGTAVVSRPSTQIGSKGDVAAIINKAEPAVVAITTGDGPGSGNGGAGTGFVITADGYVVTNNHVVDGANRVQVAFPNGDSKPADIVGTDPSADLAVLKVDGSGLAAIELGDSNAVQVGDDVVAIGNALALEGGLSVTRGIISGTDRTVEPDGGPALVGMLQTDAAINPGNSGGPLVDAAGKVIGINTAIVGGSQNVGFAIPISRAAPIIEDLRLGRTPAFLGVSTQNVTPALARELNLSVEQGAYVGQVTPNAPAADAGIQEGDVILEIGGTAIASSADVQTAIRTHRPGDSLKIVLDRKGQSVTVDATLKARPTN